MHGNHLAHSKKWRVKARLLKSVICPENRLKFQVTSSGQLLRVECAKVVAVHVWQRVERVTFRRLLSLALPLSLTQLSVIAEFTSLTEARWACWTGKGLLTRVRVLMLSFVLSKAEFLWTEATLETLL